MLKSEAQVLNKSADLLCPDCDAPVACAEAVRGRSFRCEQCQAWLYRAIWGKPPSSTAGAECCGACRSPLEGGACRSCGRRSGWWQRLLSSRWGKWVPRRAGRDIELIELDQLDLIGPPQRLSVGLQEFDALRHSIVELGLVQPLLVRATRSSRRYQVISGHRRLLALRQLGWKHAPVRILSVSEAQGARLRLVENQHREQLRPLELAELFESVYLSSHAQDPDQLARELALRPDEIRRLLSLLQSSPAVRQSHVLSEARYAASDAEEERRDESSSPPLGDPAEGVVRDARTSPPGERSLLHDRETESEDA